VARALHIAAQTLDLPAVKKHRVGSEMLASTRTGHPLLVVIVLSVLSWATLITAALAIYFVLSLVPDALP
jgi:hypothetical protein